MPRCKPGHLYAALIIATAVAYVPVWRNGFVDFDDEAYITRNPHVSQGISWPNFCWAWTSLNETYWQPLSWVSLQLDATLFREGSAGATVPAPAAFHAQSLLWHCASALLLFACLQKLLGSPWPAFAVAALFALHPMHVESVAWAAERKDVLCVFFGTLTLWAYLRFVTRPGWSRYAVVMAAFAASLLAKPMLMTLPIVLLLLDYWPLCRFGSGAREMKDGGSGQPVSFGWLLLEKLPLCVLAAVMGIVTAAARQHAGTPVSLSDLSLTARLANALSAYGHYLLSTTWPSGLAVLYEHPRENWSVGWVAGGAAALVTLTLLAVRQRRPHPWFITGWLWFVISLLPVIGFWQGGEQAWADRFSYWPHIGLFLALVCAVADIAVRLHLPPWSMALPGTLVLAGACCLTWTQTTYWRDTVTLWERVLAVSKDSYVAHLHLGRYYVELGRLDLGRQHYAEAARLLPDSSESRLCHGQVLLSLGRTAEAIAELRACIARDGKAADAWYNLGIARLRQGQAVQAERTFRKVLELEPESADARTGLGLALLRQGKRRESVPAFQAALARNPREFDAWNGLARVHLAEEQLDKAAKCSQQALYFNPQSYKSLSGLGLVLARQGRWWEAAQYHHRAVELGESGAQLLEGMGGKGPREELVHLHCHLALALNRTGRAQLAAAEYQAALKLLPDWPWQFSARAWMLATHPDTNVRDSRQAYELALQAVQAVEAPSAAMLDAQAAAEAACGDFQNAARTARLALARVSLADGQDLGPAIRRRVRLYESGKPFTGGSR